MSISSNQVILFRAQSATVHSPLALFKKTGGAIDCVFGATVTARKRKESDAGYIATIHRGISKIEITDILCSARYSEA